MKTLRRRIRSRGREMEKDIPRGYLERLDRLYEDWVDRYKMSDVLVIETDNLDYENDFLYRLDLMERVEAVLDAANPAA